MIAKLKTLISNIVTILVKYQAVQKELADLKRQVLEAEKLIDETLEKFRAEYIE